MRSPPKSPNVLLIELAYVRLGILPAARPGKSGASPHWNCDRVRRLCRWLTISVNELGALAAVTQNEMSRYVKTNKFPPPVALHFAVLESWYLVEVAGIPQKPIVPVHLAL